MDKLLECVELPPPGKHTASVIWLHGLGASGHDFPPIVPHLGLPPDHGVRFIFPHAPRIPVTINQGMVMPAWYDITALNLKREVDAAGVQASAGHTQALIAAERQRGIPSDRIVLAGFSQGGAVALYTSLRHPETLAGCIALSTYLLFDDVPAAELSTANKDLAYFVGHGRYDPMVQFKAGEMARDRLRAMGHQVTFEEYPMQHEVCLEEIQAVGVFLRKVLNSTAG